MHGAVNLHNHWEFPLKIVRFNFINSHCLGGETGLVQSKNSAGWLRSPAVRNWGKPVPENRNSENPTQNQQITQKSSSNWEWSLAKPFWKTVFVNFIPPSCSLLRWLEGTAETGKRSWLAGFQGIGPLFASQEFPQAFLQPCQHSLLFFFALPGNPKHRIPAGVFVWRSIVEPPLSKKLSIKVRSMMERLFVTWFLVKILLLFIKWQFGANQNIVPKCDLWQKRDPFLTIAFAMHFFLEFLKAVKFRTWNWVQRLREKNIENINQPRDHLKCIVFWGWDACWRGDDSVGLLIFDHKLNGKSCSFGKTILFCNYFLCFVSIHWMVSQIAFQIESRSHDASTKKSATATQRNKKDIKKESG